MEQPSRTDVGANPKKARPQGAVRLSMMPGGSSSALLPLYMFVSTLKLTISPLSLCLSREPPLQRKRPFSTGPGVIKTDEGSLKKRSKYNAHLQNPGTLSVTTNGPTPTAVVDGVRRFLERMIRSRKDQDCAVCFVVRGKFDTNHESGSDCPLDLCKKDERGWAMFQQQIRFEHGRICFACYLPTVSTRTPRSNR